MPITKQQLEEAKNTPVFKNWLTSKTVWVGIGEIAVAVLGLFADMPEEMDRVAWTMFAQGVVMILLRFATKSGVTLKKTEV